MEQDIRKEAEQQLGNSLDEFINTYVLPNITPETETQTPVAETVNETTAETTEPTDSAVDEILSLLLVDSEQNETAEVIDDAVAEEEVQEIETAESDDEIDVSIDETSDEEPVETDEDETDDDWLETLLGKKKKEEKVISETTNEKLKSTKAQSQKKAQTKPVSDPELESLRQQVESLTQLSQFLLASVQLEKWVEDTAKSALQMQEKLAQYGIQLTEDEISQAMLRASARALQDNQAFTKEIRPIVAKKMAQQITRTRRIPNQPQEASLGRREALTSNQPQDILQRERNSFEEFVLETLDEIKRRTGQ